jgi:hypothetical protein
VDERGINSELLASPGVFACTPILPTVTNRRSSWWEKPARHQAGNELCGLLLYLYSKCVSYSNRHQSSFEAHLTLTLKHDIICWGPSVHQQGTANNTGHSLTLPGPLTGFSNLMTLHIRTWPCRALLLLGPEEPGHPHRRAACFSRQASHLWLPLLNLRHVEVQHT